MKKKQMRTILYLQFVWVMFFSACPISMVLGQSQWDKYVSNPVLTPDPQLGLLGFSDPTLLFDGATIHLWISGGGFVPGGTVPGVRTYYYTSSDGLSWQGHPTNPVFREGAPGTWDSGHIETPSVITNASDFWLYYAATPDSMANKGTLLKFGLATSNDGENWIRSPTNPILERGLPDSWEERQIESPCVLKTDSLFCMWYSGIDIEWKIHVGLATSANGITWQKYPDNPVFSPLQGSSWDSVGVYAPQVRRIGNHFVMLYTGLVFSQTGYDFANTNTGLAVSEDGINWTRSTNQPVLSGTPDAWDASGPFTSDWIESNDQLLMAYVSDGKVGFATSSTVAVNVDFNIDKRSIKYALYQNYPNPFNPETIIEFGLPENSNVEISIFNVQGQKILTLIDDFKTAGFHQTKWKGTDDNGEAVASGVYLYQLRAGEFVSIKKMLLLR